jgi:S-DNA-T family DNA segregation ATPase FtsK/SpoIIIE
VSAGTRRELGGVAWLALAALCWLALAGRAGGAAGTLLARILRDGFGWEAWIIPAAVVLLGMARLLDRPVGVGRGVAVAALVLIGDGFTGLVDPTEGGLFGWLLAHALRFLLGTTGALVALGALFLAAALVATEGSLVAAAKLAGRALLVGLRGVGAGSLQAARALRDWVYPEEVASDPGHDSLEPRSTAPPPTRTRRPRALEPEAESAPAEGTAVPPLAPPPTAVRGNGMPYAPPPLELLTAPPARPVRRGKSAEERGAVLVDTLRQFGIEARLTDVSQGPTVTRFELVPPPGVKVARIVALADDIALSLAATGVRIEAPIPGKSAIGIEVPNEEVAVVWLREVLESRAFRDATSPLAVALGKDIAGQPVVAALDQMPHLLVAGATGAGKSVLINVLITSLLMRAGPNLVRLLLVDPKVVELSAYNGVPHLLTPVVTDPKQASRALRWAVKEMERRYQLFAASGSRDIGRYNRQAEEPLPYIVVVIDELADLMTVAPVEVEESIARLAQMARAAGIHLVVATQRPSVDVITGTIKANIPSRIAFAVSSQVDSRTILDAAGAEKLLGRGDMLFSPVGSPKPLRVQGAFVQESEVENVVNYLKSAVAPPPPDEEVAAALSHDEGAAGPDSEPDALFPEAVRVVVESRQASASLLQRRLRVGYTRAARLIDAMAERGFVGPPDGARPREVYLTPEQYVRLFGPSGADRPE